ncbi:hypothetical protein [Streptomyces sp. NPDC101249]|uniref:hypothetical protein n=1 Tax=Streptomyces sp. NPDC101249 TaxID=3366140 RepID=UPI00382EEFB1
MALSAAARRRARAAAQRRPCRRGQQAGHLACRAAGQRGQYPAGLGVQAADPRGGAQVLDGVGGAPETHPGVAALDQRVTVPGSAFQESGEPVLGRLELAPVGGGAPQPVGGRVIGRT